MYIYIYYHPQTDWFVGSQLFSMARLETHLTLRQADDIFRDQDCDSTSAGELMHINQISFVYILRNRMPECSFR